MFIGEYESRSRKIPYSVFSEGYSRTALRLTAPNPRRRGPKIARSYPAGSPAMSLRRKNPAA